MRVLDLGCHDGYIGSWLREQLPDVELDGVELMPEAAQKARDRGYRKVAVAAAEDAPAHFEPGTYDAVIMFELIEHVPDVGRLLSVAEQMLKPDGQVYVSTPDGTFGEGNNPHHLRAYRAQELADVLRRRGRLQDMTVGGDTVSVARYTPGPRLGDVAIFTGPCWQRWSPVDMLTKGLGGSETAATRLGGALSELGYIVTVFGDVEEECCFKDVIFRRWETFDPLERRQAVIASRTPEVFDRPVAADVRLLWMHDTDCGDRLTEQRAQKIDRVMTLSQWHRRHVEELYPFIAGRASVNGSTNKIVQVRNGIEPSFFTGEPLTRRKRVVYTSSPDRGLDLLLEMWPEIRERVPDAELTYAYSPVYWAIADQDATVGAHAARIRELSEQPGVEGVGSLSQPDVARLMRSSLVWCAPSWATPHGIPFHETSCIGAMEAQAAGCLAVASNWGALAETIKVGHLVNHATPSENEMKPSDRWREAFIEHIVEGLTNEDTQAWAQREGPKAAAELGWDGVADLVSKVIEGEAL